MGSLLPEISLSGPLESTISGLKAELSLKSEGRRKAAPPNHPPSRLTVASASGTRPVSREERLGRSPTRRRVDRMRRGKRSVDSLSASRKKRFCTAYSANGWPVSGSRNAPVTKRYRVPFPVRNNLIVLPSPALPRSLSLVNRT
jgi:hypothetical protein